MPSAPKTWADWEDRIMVVHYPDRGPDGVGPMLPRRTRVAIIRQACRLGVRWKQHPSSRTWSAADMAILTEHYPLTGAKGVQALLPQKTRDAIRVMARKHGIYCHGPRKAKQCNPIIRLPEPKRALTFEEKLALVASGKATLTRKVAANTYYEFSLTGGSLA